MKKKILKWLGGVPEAPNDGNFYTQCYRFLTEIIGLTSAQIKALQKELMTDTSIVPQ